MKPTIPLISEGREQTCLAREEKKASPNCPKKGRGEKKVHYKAGEAIRERIENNHPSKVDPSGNRGGELSLDFLSMPHQVLETLQTTLEGKVYERETHASLRSRYPTKEEESRLPIVFLGGERDAGKEGKTYINFYTLTRVKTRQKRDRGMKSVSVKGTWVSSLARRDTPNSDERGKKGGDEGTVLRY